MPQAVPNLLAIPPAPKSPPPPPQARPSESDRPDFRQELGKAKRSHPPEKKEPEKTDARKTARADKPKETAKTDKTAKEKDPQAADQGQDDSDQQQSDGQPLPQDTGGESQPRKKDAPREPKKDTVTLRSDPDAAAVVPATAVPKQPAAAKQPDQQKPESTEPRKAKAIVQKAEPTTDANGSDDVSAPNRNATAQPDTAHPADPKPDESPDPAVPHLKLGAPVAAKPQAQANVTQAVPDQTASQATDDGQQDLPQGAPQDSFADELATAQVIADQPEKVPAKTSDQTPAPPAFTLPQSSAEKGIAKVAPAAGDVQQPAPTEAQFADANHSRIVTGIHSQLLPNGGSMHLRLDPPELGALNVRVEMKDGVMTASFETTNDQATKLLSHSLSDLKTALEAQGVAVEKLHVRQSQPDSQRGDEGRQRDPDRQQQQQANQEQQRKEMLRRMWRRLMKGQDPLDLVA